MPGDVASPTYPGAPAQSQGLLQGDPTKLIGALGQIQDFQIRQQQAPALGQIPAAALAGQHISNATAQQAQEAAATSTIRSALASALAGTPNPTQDDVHSAMVNISRSNPQIAASRPDIINAAGDFVLKDGPKGIKTNAGTLLNMGLSPGEASSRVTGPPGPGGAPTSISVPQANMGGPQGIPTGNPPGFSERQAGVAATDTALSSNLSNAAEGSQSRRAILGNLDSLVEKFTPGEGADWTKVAKSFVNRNVPLPPNWKFDPASIASQEEFNKQAMQLAQQQFQTIGGTGTDSKFASAFETSPNAALSPLGNKGIIRLLKGNEDAIQAKNQAWLDQSGKNPNLSYRQFSSEFNQNFDPRAYQFKYMNQKERQAAFDAMNQDEQQRFLHAADYARKKNYVTYENPK